MPQAAEASRTVILTVDDDPGVSRTIARDLRRRYAESFRIVHAESGESALEALRELKLRGDLVAVVLADYRMPRSRRGRSPTSRPRPVLWTRRSCGTTRRAS